MQAISQIPAWNGIFVVHNKCLAGNSEKISHHMGKGFSIFLSTSVVVVPITNEGRNLGVCFPSGLNRPFQCRF